MMNNQNHAEPSVVNGLSRRLATLAEWVPQGAQLADIGTDHALLPVYLAGRGKIAFAVAGDLYDGPLQAARRQVAAAGLTGRIDVRQGDGLAVIRPGEVDTVCMAGMGGGLITRLLTDGADRLSSVRTLVLSPHGAEYAVRQWLMDNRYLLQQELLLEEDGVIYTLMKAVRASDEEETAAFHRRLYDEKLLAPCAERIPMPMLLEMGPILLRAGGREFHAKWEQEIAKRKRAIGQMRKSASPKTAAKISRWEEDIAIITEVLACLPKEKRSFNAWNG